MTAVPPLPLACRGQHLAIESEPFVAYGRPAVPFARGTGGGDEPSCERIIVEQTENLSSHGGVIVERYEQAVDAVFEDGGHAARTRGHCRQAARERFEDRRWHVVEVRGLHVDVRVGVEPPDFGRRDRPEEADLSQPELLAQRLERGALRSAARQRQPGAGMTLLHEVERADRAGDVVHRLEAAGGQQVRAEWLPEAECETVEIDRVWNDPASDAVVREDVGQETRRHRHPVTPRGRTTREPRPPQVVRRLAAAVVQEHSLAQHSARENCRERCEQE
jgi:hypothetical protein